MANEWWLYPRIDNFGTIDPQGNYWKPDSNIQLPGGYPITALLPGTITSMQATSFGQATMTIRLDTPLNSLATDTFYEHMEGFSTNASVGTHVNAGDLIGYNNPAGQTPLGFGLYPGDVYAEGPGWNMLQQDLAPGGQGLLNPTALLNAASQGQLDQFSLPNSYFGGMVVGAGGVNALSALSSISDPLTSMISSLQPLWDWLQDPARVFKLIGGLLLIGVSLYMLIQPDASGDMLKSVKGAFV